MFKCLFQVHDNIPTVADAGLIPVLCSLIFVGCVVGLFQRLSKRPRKDSQLRSSLKGVDKCTLEPGCWGFSKIKPLENGSWEEAEEIPYRPFREGPYFLNMGLKSMPAENWIEIDKTYLSRLDYKRQLFSQHRDETVVFLPGAEEASFEALEMLADFLPRRYPSMFKKTSQGINNSVTGEDWNLQRNSNVWMEKQMHPLEVMSLLSTEDWVIMQKEQEGGDEYHLRAGAVCFPSGWRIAELIGHSLYQIHAGNVPQYKLRIAKSMDRFFSNLKVSSPIQRFNNGLEISSELFHIRPHHNLGEDQSENLTIDNIYLRVERQTLRRLPRSRALLFGIRTYITPIRKVTTNREVARVLRAQIESYPEDVAGYKNKHVWKVIVMGHLDEVLGEL